MASFYKSVENKTYINVFYAVNIALDNYLSSRLLNGDLNRIIYSSTEYALTKRSGQQPWNNANLPFINYKQSDKAPSGDRQWFSFEAYSQGVYVPELRKKLRLVPATFSYDCSYWTSRDDDYQYAADKIIVDNSYETKLKFSLDYDGTLIENIAIVNFNFDASPKFTELDWLEKNNIHTLSLNTSIQTFIPVDNTAGFCIPKKVLIDFLISKDLIPASDGEIIEYDEAFQMTIDHYNETVTIV